MLVNVSTGIHPIANVVADAAGNSRNTEKLETGIYLIGHFSFNHIIIGNKIKDEWPEFEDNPEFREYGVCDDYKQVLEKYPELISSKRQFVMSVTPINKSKQPADGGWRWHKWGEYIGNQKPTREYLHDEPIIEKVFVYHIYELI
jgi:hypothetical protein